MREVRWILQASRKGMDDWINQNDRIYDGWFYSSGDDEPNPTLLAQYEKAVEELDWLDVRLIQETRSFQSTVLKQTIREVTDEATPAPDTT